LHYRREIDGLRAVAVVPVILFHAHAPWLPGGFIGVDIFFVISGFLITSILAEDLEKGRYNLGRFYERRVRRILPALYLVVLATLPWAFALMLPARIEDFSASLGAMVVFLSNFFFLSQVGYFSPDAELQPLLHTWSLAVEEQYYLLFPPLLALLWRRGRGWTMAVLALLAGASFLVSMWGAVENPGRNFYFTGSRAWELLAGALAALVVRRGTVRGNDLLAGAGLAATLGAILFWVPGTAAPGAWMLVPVAGTVLVLLYAQSGTWAARLLSLPGFVGIGLISYSAYLWHQPLFALARLHFVGDPSVAFMGALIVATLGLAWATWAMVEQPFRRRTSPLLARRRHLFLAAAVLGGGLFGIGVAGKTTDGFRDLWLRIWPDRAAVLQVVEKAQTVIPVQDDGACRFNVEEADAPIAQRILACHRRHGPGVAVLGDSHAIDLFGIIVARPERPFVVGFTKPSCRPGTVDRVCPYASFESFVTTHPGVFSVTLFTMSGAYLLRGEDGLPGVQTAIESLPLGATVPSLPLVEAEIDRVNAALAALAVKVPVVWFGPRIEPQVHLELLVSRGCETGLAIRQGTEENFLRLDAELARISAVPYLAQNSLLQLQFPRDIGGCDGLLWKDGDHYSAIGVMEMARRADVVDAALGLLR
jgi:peptidoglycan/LPS O-acetylase OafA/YrhL